MNEEYMKKLMDALTEIIMSESSDDMKAIRMQILQRIANEVANVTPRMPAPLNITEIGGYYNLLNRMGQEETLTMRKRLVATALGIPME